VCSEIADERRTGGIERQAGARCGLGGDRCPQGLEEPVRVPDVALEREGREGREEILSVFASFATFAFDRDVLSRQQGIL